MMPSGSVAALGMRLSALSMLQGRASLSPTTAQSSSVYRFGALLSRNRRTITASISQLAAMLILRTFWKTSAIALALPEAVYHPLHLVQLRL